MTTGVSDGSNDMHTYLGCFADGLMTALDSCSGLSRSEVTCASQKLGSLEKSGERCRKGTAARCTPPYERMLLWHGRANP